MLTGNFGNFSEMLEAYWEIWKLTGNFGNFSEMLEAYREFWKVSGDLLDIFHPFATLHKLLSSSATHS